MSQNVKSPTTQTQTEASVDDPIVKAKLFFLLKEGREYSNTIELKYSEIDLFRENLLKSLQMQDHNGYLNLIGSCWNIKDFIIITMKEIVSIQFQIQLGLFVKYN